MKVVVLFISLLFSLLLTAQEEKVKGIYLTEGGEAKVKIFKATNGKYYGKFAWLEDKDAIDDENPDPKLRNRPLKDMIFMKNFVYDEATKQWSKGLIYDAESGKMYECYMWFEDNENELNIRGFVMGMKMLGRTTVWTRTKE